MLLARLLSDEFMASAQRWPVWLLLSVAAGRAVVPRDAEHGALRLYQPGGRDYKPRRLLNGFGNMAGVDRRAGFQVGDGARQPQDAMVGAAR